MPATRKLFHASSPKRAAPGSPGSDNASLPSSPTGSAKPMTTGAAQMSVASVPRQPVSRGCAGGFGLRIRLTLAVRAAPRDHRSSSTAATTKASSAPDSCAAATLSPSENHAR